MSVKAALLLVQQSALTTPRLRGLLFGYQSGTTMHVLLASSLGSPTWYGRSYQRPTDIDLRFAAGWSEALFELFDERLTCIGTWAMHPDGDLQDQVRDLRLFGSGRAPGLLNEAHLLLAVGLYEGSTAARAYICRRGHDYQEISCDFGLQNYGNILKQWL
ncbi:hypothetical protein GO986_17360 [Deinococcus sp. HMF7620]|uniref:Uncharacterized protein n=1 Tax=Deinococcus arboris TaxID=2682977 RepID=A0A7C9I4X2_9DEIO|nr:hypothetical protein [Deinococcus arboris]MVN88511.1 hypothetical protein [Deinococcus arboris]